MPEQGAPPLVWLSFKKVVLQIDSVTDIGELRWSRAQHIVSRVKTAEQLRTIESNSPHLADHTAVYWKRLIRKDCGAMSPKEEIPEPVNPRSWWKVHRKLVKEDRAKAAQAEETLRKAMLGLKANKPQIIHINRATAHEREEAPVRVDGVKNTGLEARHNGIRKATVSKSALTRAKTGRDAISAIRKQAAAAAHDRLMAQRFVEARKGKVHVGVLDRTKDDKYVRMGKALKM